MSTHCPHCGQQARSADRVCVSCGREVNPGVPPEGASTGFRAPDHPQRRTGNWLVAHARGVMALAAVAALIAVGAIAGSSGDTTPGPGDSAPASEVAAEKERAATEPTKQSDTSSSEDNAPAAAVTTTGADGKTYSCNAGVLDRVDTAKDRVTRREKVLKSRRAEVRNLRKQYPDGKAPGDVVDRYNDLLARANAQVRWTNKAVAQYNRVLRDACDPT